MAHASDIEYDDATHTYRRKADGLVLAGVTDTIKRGLLGEDGGFFSEAAALRGTHVHTATEYDDEGALDFDALDDGLKPYIEAWRRFRRETGVRILASEAVVYHPTLLYAGRIDRLVSFATEPYPLVLDIKSGSPRREHAIQTAAYAAALAAMSETETPGRLCVYLRKDGSYRTKFYIDSEHGRDFAAFTAALTVCRWREAA